MKKLKKPNKFLESIKQGLVDIKTVAQEGNLKLFLKPAVVIIVLILGYRWASNQLAQQAATIKTKREAIAAQQSNEKSYLSNKKKLLNLEPRFPDLSAKNDWLLRQVVAVFKNTKLTPKMAASQTETTANNGFVVTSIPVEMAASYADVGHLVADIENRNEFLKVSEVAIVKHNESLGMNSVKLQINTVFPKEKIADTLSKKSTRKK